MDKIKNLLCAPLPKKTTYPYIYMSSANSRCISSGISNKEDESTNDPNTSSHSAGNTGRLTGEGSHLKAATGNTGVLASLSPEKPNY